MSTASGRRRRVSCRDPRASHRTTQTLTALCSDFGVKNTPVGGAVRSFSAMRKVNTWLTSILWSVFGFQLYSCYILNGIDLTIQIPKILLTYLPKKSGAFYKKKKCYKNITLYIEGQSCRTFHSTSSCDIYATVVFFLRVFVFCRELESLRIFFSYLLFALMFIQLTIQW